MDSKNISIALANIKDGGDSVKYSKNVGKTINELEVIGTTNRKRHTYYIIRCVECGAISEKRGDTVSDGQAKCECKYKDRLHGKSRSKIYRAWGSMKSRLNISKWSIETAFNTPVRKCEKR